MAFMNRKEAGRKLGEALLRMSETDPALQGERVVMALPRGGVPIAIEVARALSAPVDLIMVRKVGVPYQPELAAAAVVDGDTPTVVRNEDVISSARLSDETLDTLVKTQLEEIERRRSAYGAARTVQSLADKVVIVVDDGIATGATAEAALRAVRAQNPKSVLLAVPVSPASTLRHLQTVADRAIALLTPHPFYAVGAHYHDFGEVSDNDVIRVLQAARDPGMSNKE